jgi:uncharacterized membrane protein
MTGDSLSSAETRIAELTTRVWRLEEALRRNGIAVEKAELSASSVAQAHDVSPLPLDNASTTDSPVDAMPSARKEEAVPTLGPPLATAPLRQTPPPAFGLFAASGPSKVHEESLESRIGSQWFNRIGILAVLIAMAWFLKLAIDNHWIGPLGRVLIGLLAGAGLIAWSERFRTRGYAAFSYSLKALGSGTLYLSLWAAFSLYQLLPGGVAFAAMIAVTTFNGIIAWVQDSELLAAYAIAGGLSTPLLLSTGENHEITLFSYLLLLDVAVLTLAALKPWSRLVCGAFAGTLAFYIGWSSTFYAADELRVTSIFIAIYFVLFAAAPRLVLGHRKSDSGRALWDQMVQTAMPIANAIFGFLALLRIFWNAGYHGTGPWLAVIFAAFYLLMLNLPAQGRWRQSPQLLDGLHLSAAVTFLTIAIPLKAHGRWITIGWLAEGVALFWIESKIRAKLLEALSLICLALGLAAAAVLNSLNSTTPVFNARFGCYIAAMTAMAVVAYLAAHREKSDEAPTLLRSDDLGAAAVLAINVLVLLAVGWEIDTFWWVRSWKGQAALLHSYEMYAQFTYSAFFMLFGAVLLAVGFWRRSAFLRWQALVLLAVTIGKVFLWDMSALSQGYRILSFLGLGGLLLAISFVYQRDWLRLRSADANTADAEEKRA